MRQAARHLAPGGIALRLQQRGDIVEHQNHAGRAAGIVGQRGARAHQHMLSRLRQQLDLFAPVELLRLQALLDGAQELREQRGVADGFVERLADGRLEIDAQYRAGRLIGGAHF